MVNRTKYDSGLLLFLKGKPLKPYKFRSCLRQKKRFISSASVGPTYVISSNFGNTERILEIRNSAESYCLADSDRWTCGSRYRVVF